MIVKKELSYFELLGLNETATLDDVKKSYKKLVQIYHPDKYQDAQAKKDAEKQFKVIKKAYDQLIALFEQEGKINEQTEESDLTEVYSNAEFINFFTSKNINIEEYEHKEYSKKQIEKAINFIKRNIDLLNLDLRYVYTCIAKSKLFIDWQLSSQQEVEYIMKNEIIYRNYVKSLPSYQCFINNKKFFYSPDVNLTIKIRPEVAQHKFSQTIYYTINSFCEFCLGEGCDFCHNGIIAREVSKTICFTHIEDGAIYKLKNEGSQFEDIVKGSLNIKFIYDKHLKEPYEVLQKFNKSDNKKANNHNLSSPFIAIYNFIKQHNIHFIYLSIILVIIIVALLLIFLV